MTIIKRDLEDWVRDIEYFDYGVFILPQWVESIVRERDRSIYLDFEDDGVVVAKIAGIEMDFGWVKGVHLYFYSGIALRQHNTAVYKSCLYELLRYAKENHFSKVSIRPFDHRLGEKIEIRGYKVLRSIEYRIDFDKGSDRPRFSDSFKRNVRRAQKNGIEFGVSASPEYLDHMLQLIQSTHDIRLKKYGVDYNHMGFQNLTDVVLRKLVSTNICKFYYGTHNGEVICVMMSLISQGRNFGFLMGAEQRAYQMGVSAFIDQKIVDGAEKDGLVYLNLGGIPPLNEGGEGIRKYKEGMGALPYDAYGYYSQFLTFPRLLLNPLFYLSGKMDHFAPLRMLKILLLTLLGKRRIW